MITFTQEQAHILSQVKSTAIKKGFPFFKTKKSFYIWGGTGTGKTTIVEHFAMECKLANVPVLFMHFHDYLLDVTKLSTKMSIKEITKEIAKKFKILCFDEFFVESIADAKILHDIFHHLIKNGVAIVATSNFKPEDLYHNGFNRNLVFPMFSNFLNEEMFVIEVKNKKDFRLEHNNEFKQIGFKTANEFEEAFLMKIIYKHEKITVDLNHHLKIIGKFQANDALMGVVLNYKFFQKHSSIKDYRHLARQFSHVHIENMQEFHAQNEDEAIRFRNFIDILYMRATIFTYSGHVLQIFSKNLLENIKFKRCNSRLVQMETVQYQQAQNNSFKRKANVAAFEFFQSFER